MLPQDANVIDIVQAFWQVFPPLSFRIWGMLAVLPLGDGFQGMSRRGILTFLFALAVFNLAPVDFVSLNQGTNDRYGLASVFELGLEFLMGMLLGIPFALAVALSLAWGELLDAGRGQTISSMYDPMQGNSHSTLGVLSEQALWLGLVSVGAFEGLLVAVVRSCSVVPLGLLSHSYSSFLGTELLSLIAQEIRMVLGFSLLALVLFLTIELLFGLIGKAVPSVSFSSEVFQIKSFCGLILFVLVCQSELINQLSLQICKQPAQLLNQIESLKISSANSSPTTASTIHGRGQGL